MIRYTLQCATGHAFDGWFKNSAAYDAAASHNELSCPQCGSVEVTKALMAPNISTSRRKAAARAPTTEQHSAPVDTPNTNLATAPPELRKKLRELRDAVLSKADYVGPRFAEEARKAHDADACDRAIWGEATPEETRDLLEDGITVLPIPRLPEDHN